MRNLMGYILFGVMLLTPFLVNAEEVGLTLKNGLNVKGTLALAEGKTVKEDGVVLFVHGTLAHQDMAIVSAQRDLLNERETNVLSINLSLGIDNRTGMYDCAVPHTHKHQDALDEIDAWLSWLEKQGANSVILMGHSRGGNQVAWHAAERKNPLVKKLVLVAPQTWRVEKETAFYEKRYRKSFLPVLKDMMSKVEAGLGGKLVADVDFIYCENAKVTPYAFVGYYKADIKLNTPSLFNQIQKPILVVAGTQDTVVADLPKQMEKVDLANVSFTIIEDADHMFIDFAGEDLADQVAQFIFEN